MSKCTQVLVDIKQEEEVDKCTQTQVPVATSLEELLDMWKQVWAKHATFHSKLYKSEGDRFVVTCTTPHNEKQTEKRLKRTHPDAELLEEVWDVGHKIPQLVKKIYLGLQDGMTWCNIISVPASDEQDLINVFKNTVNNDSSK